MLVSADQQLLSCADWCAVMLPACGIGMQQNTCTCIIKCTLCDTPVVAALQAACGDIHPAL